MARWRQGVALCVAWLGVSVPAQAQFLPMSENPEPGAGQVFQAADNSGGTGNDPATPGAPATACPPGTPQVSGGLPYMQAPAGPVVPLAPVVGTPTTSGTGPENAFSENCLPKTSPTCLHANFEYLHLVLQKAPVPILMTTGSLNDPVPGALGQANTRVLLDEVQGGAFARTAGRLSLAYDLDDLKTITVSANYFLSESGTATQAVGSDASGTPVLVRPFFNVNLGLNDADPIALPNIMSGRFAVSEPHRLQGGEFNCTYNFFNSSFLNSRFGVLLGARYLRLNEELNIQADSTDLPGLGIAGNLYSLRENFSTRNRFYGSQLGAEWECQLGSLAVTLAGTCAVGHLDQNVNIGSFTSITEPDGTITAGANTALLVGPGNAGSFSHHRLIVVPAGEAKVSYAFNDNVSVSAGYLFLYMSDVVRPGNQISPAVNVQSVPAVPTPPLTPGPPNLATSNLAVQGFSVGLLLSY